MTMKRLTHDNHQVITYHSADGVDFDIAVNVTPQEIEISFDIRNQAQKLVMIKVPYSDSIVLVQPPHQLLKGKFA